MQDDDLTININEFSLQDKISFYHRLGKDIEAELSCQKDYALWPASLLEASRSQSQIYMMHIIRVLWQEFKKFPYGTNFSILDVGPGTGAGSELLAAAHSQEYSGYYANVDVLDIDDSLIDYFEFKNPHISAFHHQNIFDFKKTFDFVICSHCLEHVPEPYEFALRLQELARNKALITAPWKENPRFLTKGHINIFDEGFIKKFPEKEFFTEPCVAWGMMMEPRYEQFCLILDGKASNAGY